MFVWSTNTPMRPRSDIAPTRDGVISGIVPWGYMRVIGYIQQRPSKCGKANILTCTSAR